MIFLAPFLFNLTGLIDTYLVKRFDQEEQKGNIHHGIGTLMIFASIVALITILCIIPRVWNDFAVSLSSANSLRLLGAGLIYGIAALPYFYALQQESLENILPFLQLIPLRSMLISYFFLGEQLSVIQIVIITSITLLTILFGFNHLQKQWNLTAIGLMILCAFLYASRSVLFKFAALQESSFWVSIIWEHIGVVVVGLRYIGHKKTRISTLSYIRNSGWSFSLLNIANELIYIIGVIILNFASLSQYVVIVSLLSTGIQPLLGFAMSYGAYRLLPGTYERNYSQKTLIFKIVLTLIILCLLGVFFSL